jgi:hypothetical protein
MEQVPPDNNAPIVFFAYNRPEHTRQALESLSKCERAGDSELFIYCDGPKNAEDAKAVQELRKIVKDRQWCGTVKIILREENMGLAKSVISGVTEIVDRYGKVIVLEDDLVLSPQFLNYMNDALILYKDIPRIMHIAGYMFPVKGVLPETFFYRDTSCWGWATWQRAWAKFEPSADKLLSGLHTRKQRREFNIEGRTDYYRMLQNQSTGKIDAWAIRWYASVFLNNGLCLHPGKSLVNNIGHDGTGIHCGTTNIYTVQPNNDRISSYTQDIEECKDAVRLMKAFYRSLKKPLPLRVINKLLRMAQKTRQI